MFDLYLEKQDSAFTGKNVVFYLDADLLTI